MRECQNFRHSRLFSEGEHFYTLRGRVLGISMSVTLSQMKTLSKDLEKNWILQANRNTFLWKIWTELVSCFLLSRRTRNKTLGMVTSLTACILTKTVEQRARVSMRATKTELSYETNYHFSERFPRAQTRGRAGNNLSKLLSARKKRKRGKNKGWREERKKVPSAFVHLIRGPSSKKNPGTPAHIPIRIIRPICIVTDS